MKKPHIAILLVAFAALIALFASGLGHNPQELPSVTTGKPLPAFDLPALDDSRRYTNADLPQDTPYLINIWGSWCPACHDEHPYRAFSAYPVHARAPLTGCGEGRLLMP